MRTFYLTLLLSLTFYSSIAQSTIGNRVMTVDEMVKLMSHIKSQVEKFSVDSFNIYFEKNLNDYRVSKDLNVVCYRKEILPVATEQSSYCLRLGFLTHKQSTSIREDVDDRCKIYCVDCFLSHENLMSGNMSSLLIFYFEGMNFYDCLSKLVLQCWKLSPGHNSTLLTYGHDFAVGISLNSTNDMVACFVLLEY